MAPEPLLNSVKYGRSYRNFSYQRFFVCLLVFIVASFVLVLILNSYNNSLPRTDFHAPVSLDYRRAGIVPVKSDSIESSPKSLKCNYWNCFDVYKCGKNGHNKITIYIYPLKNYQTEDGQPISHFSREFYKILDTIKHSKYYTSDPDEACLFIPSIDTLNQNYFSRKQVGQVLQSLEFWNDGTNHLILNFLSGSPPNYETTINLNTGKAIIAGAGFDTWTFRYGFDISLPLPSEVATKINSTQPKQKQYLIISSQTNIPEDYEATLRSIASSSNELLFLEECPERDPSKRCEYITGKVHNYPDILKEGIFCLVVRSARLIQVSLLDVIASQCIPVIIADSVVMPFNSHIDWEKMALFIPENNIKSLFKVVNGVSEDRKAEMYWQLRYLFDKYFSCLEQITLTMLEILNEKVFPLAARMYEDWNLPEYLYGPVNPLFLPVIASKAPGFTAVVLTFNRIDSLFTLIKKLARTPSLAKILVVWNNQELAPPEPSEWPVISKPLKVIRTKANKLSNRFFPYDDIETECQLTIDDDIVMLTPDELEFGFDVWREFPDRIVGFPSRLHVWDNVTSSWRYHSEWTNEISMVLTGAAFHHKIWSWYYTYKMPVEIRNRVDDEFNCEDIAMNFLVANVTRKAPIKVTPRKKFKCPECKNTEMLSADARHMQIRSACINDFTKIYGHMALKTVEFRADPLQYMEEGTGIPLLYPEIGAL